ncbi:U5 small nuclear ribonucleoprotein 200 kDa helicase-like protein [Trifolium pratense]|uniref:U5 small nuclear ribonucleoprotein 200 kDa helicase-like protein n=1 Tax=Trifolium pratense TaxID=57577 RepID=A0A2K3MLA9_TRIPR|nr:U5 small nuclear ribonucleoprotein 200 kDa helicase-like protein [Trifolium pratense]
MKGEEDGGKAAAKSGGLKPQCKYKFNPNKIISVQEPLVFKATFVLSEVRPPKNRGIYQPKTDETRAAYDQMFSIIEELFALEDDFLAARFYVNRIIALLKTDAIDNDLKKREVNSILNNSTTDDLFHRLVSFADLLTDFHDPPVL